MPATETLLLLASALLSAACIVHLWGFKTGSVLRKAFWSLALLVPVIGPVFYAGVYRVPPKQPEMLQGVVQDAHTGG